MLVPVLMVVVAPAAAGSVPVIVSEALGAIASAVAGVLVTLTTAGAHPITTASLVAVETVLSLNMAGVAVCRRLRGRQA